jgi:amino acid permease
MFLSSSYLIGFIFTLVIFYAVMKEREELGCYRISIGRQCIDEDSVYLKNTKASKEDNCNDLHGKIESILSYHEKGGVWKRCIIIATIITFFIYIVYNTNNTINNNINQYTIFLLIIFAIIYFYHNYINYHHFRKLKQNGIEILQLIKRKCNYNKNFQNTF